MKPLAAACADVVKEATRNVHAETEGLLIPQIKKIHSPAQYAQLLRLFYGFFAPLERQVSPFLEPLLPDWLQRRKAHGLLQDLHALQHFEPVPVATQLPVVNNPGAALGVWYVLEGSTLGGPHIARMLQQRLVLPDTVLTFFTGYGAHTVQRWNDFKAVLNASAGEDGAQQQVVVAAAATFQHLKQWILNFDACHSPEPTTM